MHRLPGKRNRRVAVYPVGDFGGSLEMLAELKGLDEAKAMMAQNSDFRQSTSAPWHGKSKLEALALSKKALHNEPEFTNTLDD